MVLLLQLLLLLLLRLLRLLWLLVVAVVAVVVVAVDVVAGQMILAVVADDAVANVVPGAAVVGAHAHRHYAGVASVQCCLSHSLLLCSGLEQPQSMSSEE
jgi:hypothetical protein